MSDKPNSILMTQAQYARQLRHTVDVNQNVYTKASVARTAGALSPEEADELERVIEEGCEKIDEHGW